MHHSFTKALWGASAICLVSGAAPALAQWAPSKPVEFVVASGAGGGTDQFARIVQSIGPEARADARLGDRHQQGRRRGHGSLRGRQSWRAPIRTSSSSAPTTNGCSRWSPRRLCARRPAPHRRHGARRVPLWTHKDAPTRDTAEFVAAAKAGACASAARSPRTPTRSCPSISSSRRARASSTSLQVGGEAATQLAGGHNRANFNNPQENMGQWRGGLVRPLCVFSPERMSQTRRSRATWPVRLDLRRAGLPVEEYGMRAPFWTNGEVADEAVAYYATSSPRCGRRRNGWNGSRAPRRPTAS